MELNNIFAERLKESLKMTETALSKATGITETSISLYLKGERTPSVQALIRISKTLNVSIDYLLGLSEGKNGDKEGTIDVSKALEYCDKQRKSWAKFQLKALEQIKNGKTSFEAAAYGAKQEELYGYFVPNVLRALGKTTKKEEKKGEKKNEN